MACSSWVAERARKEGVVLLVAEWLGLLAAPSTVSSAGPAEIVVLVSVADVAVELGADDSASTAAAAAWPPSCSRAIDSDETATPRIRSTVEPVVVTVAANVATPLRAADTPLPATQASSPLQPLARAFGSSMDGDNDAAVVVVREGMNLAGTGCACPLLVVKGEAPSNSVWYEGG